MDTLQYKPTHVGVYDIKKLIILVRNHSLYGMKEDELIDSYRNAAADLQTLIDQRLAIRINNARPVAEVEEETSKPKPKTNPQNCTKHYIS